MIYEKEIENLRQQLQIADLEITILREKIANINQMIINYFEGNELKNDTLLFGH